jgi:hypothetical protein
MMVLMFFVVRIPCEIGSTSNSLLRRFRLMGTAPLERSSVGAVTSPYNARDADERDCSDIVFAASVEQTLMATWAFDWMIVAATHSASVMPRAA